MANEYIKIFVQAVADTAGLSAMERKLQNLEQQNKSLLGSTEALNRELSQIGRSNGDLHRLANDQDAVSVSMERAAARASELGGALGALRQRQGELRRELAFGKGSNEQVDELNSVNEAVDHLTKNLAQLKTQNDRNAASFNSQRSVLNELDHSFQKVGDRVHALDVRHLGRDMDQTAQATENLARQVDNAERHFRDLGNLNMAGELNKIGRELRQAAVNGESFAHAGSQVLFDFESLQGEIDRVATHVDRLDNSLGRSLRSIGHEAAGSKAQIGGLVTQIDLLQREAERLGLDNVIRDLEQMKQKVAEFETPLRGLDRAMGLFGLNLKNNSTRTQNFRNALGLTSGEVDKFRQKLADASQADEAFGRAVRIMAQRAIIFGSALTALLPFIGEFIGALGSAASGAFSMIAALSQLAGFLATLPGLFAAAAGAAGGLFAVIQPRGILSAVQGVLSAQKQNQANQATGGTGGSSGATTPAGAEQNLHELKLQNALQEQQAELSLRQAKLETYRQLQEAERNLAEIRKQAAIDEGELKSDVANAKARLAGLVAEGADKSAINAARSEVHIAETRLKQQRVDDSKKIKDAEVAVDQARVDGVLRVKQAELSLQSTRLSNAQQLQSAEAALTKARTGSADAGIAGVRAYQIALAGLDPVQRAVVLKIVALRNEFQKLTQPTRDRILHGFLEFLTFIQGQLPRIAKLLDRFAGAIADVAGKFAKFIEKPKNLQIIFDIFKAGIPLVRILGDALFQVFKALTKIAEAAKPLTTFVAKGIDGLAKSFSDAVTGGTKTKPATGSVAVRQARGIPVGGQAPTSGLGGFLQGTMSTATQLRDILKQIGRILGGLFSASAPSGNTLLGALDHFLKGIADFVDHHQNKIRKFFENQVPVVEAFAGVLVAVGKGLGQITAALSAPTKGGGKSQLQTTLELIRDHFIPAVTDLLIEFTTNLGPSLFQFLGDLGDVLKTLLQPDGPLKGTLDAMDLMLQIVKKILDLPGVKTLLGPVGYWVAIFLVMGKVKSVLLDGILGPLVDIPKRLVKFKEDWVKRFGEARDAVSKIKGGLQDIGGGAKNLFGKIKTSVGEQLQPFVTYLRLQGQKLRGGFDALFGAEELADGTVKRGKIRQLFVDLRQAIADRIAPFLTYTKIQAGKLREGLSKLFGATELADGSVKEGKIRKLFTDLRTVINNQVTNAIGNLKLRGNKLQKATRDFFDLFQAHELNDGTIKQGKIRKLFTDLKTVIDTQVTNLLGNLKIRGGKLKQALTNLFAGGAEQGAGKGLGEALKGRFTIMKQAIVQGVGSVVGVLSSNAKLIGTAMKDGLATAGTAIRVFVFETLIPALVSATSASIAFIASNPILLIVAALAIAVILIATHWDQIKHLFFEALHFIEDKIGDFLGFIDKHWKVIALLAGPILGPIIVLIELIKNHWDTIKKDALKAWTVIHDVLVGAWNRVDNFFTKTIPAAFDKIKGVFSGLWDDIAGGVDTGWNAIIGTLDHWIATFASIIDKVTGFLGLGKPLEFLEQLDDTSLQKADRSSHKHHGRAEGAVHDFEIGGVPTVGEVGHGIVKPVPGGIFRVAEAGHPEAIMSLDPKHAARTAQIMDFVMRRLFGGSLFGTGGIPSGLTAYAGGGLAAGGNKHLNHDNVLGAVAAFKDAVSFDLPSLSGSFGAMVIKGLRVMRGKVFPFLADKIGGAGKGILKTVGKALLDGPILGPIDLLHKVGVPGVPGVPFATGGVTGVPRQLNTARLRSNLSYSAGPVASFAMGGITGFASGGVASDSGDGTKPVVNLTVNTASEKADIDYIARVIETRLQRF